MDTFSFHRQYALPLSIGTHHVAKTSIDGIEVLCCRQFLEAAYDVLLYFGQSPLPHPRSYFCPIWLTRLTLHATGYQFHHLCHTYLHYAAFGTSHACSTIDPILTFLGRHHLTRPRSVQRCPRILHASHAHPGRMHLCMADAGNERSNRRPPRSILR